MSDSYENYDVPRTMPKEIAVAVLAVMDEVGYVQKKGVNSFQNYKYASIEGVLEKVQPALVKAGLLIVQSEHSHAIVAEDNMMEATYLFSLIHKSGVQAEPVKVTSLSGLRNSKGGYDDKALNKCNTAARKYFILGLFQIPTGLEVDADAEEDKAPVTVDVSGRALMKTAAPNGANGKLRTTADFVQEATEAVNASKTQKELAAWIDKNAAKLELLATKDPNRSNVLQDLIDGRMSSMSTLAAG